MTALSYPAYRLLLVWLLALGSMPSLSLAQQTGEVLVDRANVRAEPSIEAKVVATIARGSRVAVLEQRAGWSKVQQGSITGFVRSNLLRVTGTVPEPATGTGSAPRADPAPPPADARPLPRRGVPDDEQPEATSNRPRSGTAVRGQAERVRDNAIGFGVGRTMVGGQLWTGVFGTTAVGGFVERGIRSLGDEDEFTLGIAAAVDYYAYDIGRFGRNEIRYRVIPVSVSGLAHFRLDEPRLDPFVGFGVGYNVIQVDVQGGPVARVSGLFVGGQAGVRWHFSPALAAHAQLGFGIGVLGVGLAARF
jgi:hypothetical protein